MNLEVIWGKNSCPKALGSSSKIWTSMHSGDNQCTNYHLGQKYPGKHD